MSDPSITQPNATTFSVDDLVTAVNTIFNLARTLYSNERIPVAMSQLVLNAAGDGYGTNPSSNLSKPSPLCSPCLCGSILPSAIASTTSSDNSSAK